MVPLRVAILGCVFICCDDERSMGVVSPTPVTMIANDLLTK